MVKKSKKPSFSTLYNARRRMLRSAGKVSGHSVARGKGDSSDVEATKKGSESESVHAGDRDSADEQAEAQHEADMPSGERGETPSEKV